MDSTPLHETSPKSLSSSSSSSSASKLPIKQKAPYLLPPKLQSSSSTTADPTLNFDTKPSPFKFHRIWTEPDEIRFLQGLLDSSSHGRDLGIFYHNFSNTMPQPYTKSQLSQKLRRLRKKFRVISSRLSRGLNPSLLSPHDRAHFDLSKKLWSAEFASVNAFGTDITINSNATTNISLDYAKRINSVGVKVAFSPVFPATLSNDSGNTNRNAFGSLGIHKLNDGKTSVDCRMVEAQKGDCQVAKSVLTNTNRNAFGSLGIHKLNDGKTSVDCGMVEAQKGDCQVAKSVLAKSIVNVFDESLKEVQRVHERKLRALVDSKDFERKWRLQRVTEVDVLARRLRLVLENSVNRPSNS